MIKFCKKCLYPSTHPLGLIFNKDGICSGCLVHQEKFSLDWDFRLNKLKKIVKQYSSKKNNYDCIVPVTGGTDSFFILHIVKNVLKLNPLLVHYNKYYNTNTGIENLAKIRIKFGCDMLIQNPNMNSIKKITKYTLYTKGNIYWHCLAGNQAFAVQTSIKYQIPLIIWGANQGIEQVGMFSHKDEVEMTKRYWVDHDLSNLKTEDILKDTESEVREEDLISFFYPEFGDLIKNGTRGIYLGNYIPWNSKKQNELMIKKYDYKTFKNQRSFDNYQYFDCYNYLNLHDLLKFYKHGYSKVTDQVCREIRFDRISRQKGVNIIKHYETKKIQHIDLFLKWLGLSDQDSFMDLIESFKNEKFWKKIDIKKYRKKVCSDYHERTNINSLIKFVNSPAKSISKKKGYIYFGKGF